MNVISGKTLKNFHAGGERSARARFSLRVHSGYAEISENSMNRRARGLKIDGISGDLKEARDF